MLFQRVLTAFALLFIILGAVFGLSPTLFKVFIGIVIGLAIWEWSSLAGLKAKMSRVVYLAVMIIIFILVERFLSANSLMMGGAICFWFVVFYLVYRFPAGSAGWGNRHVLMLIGLPLFLPGWIAFALLRDEPYFAFHILFMLGLVASADIGAYFAGRHFGRHKLASEVSPNKTWEGVAGGLAGACLLMVMISLLFINPRISLTPTLWLSLVGAALCIAAVSVVGDLFESMVKRFRNVKDSGNILPGHGGMLDRIDGLTAAAPIYALFVLVLSPVFS